MAEASGKSRAADEILRVKRIFVFDRTNHNRNESRRDFRRATRPIHRHRADEWKKHPQWVLLVHSSGILAFRLVAFAPFQGARLSAPEPAAMSLTNFRFIATMPTSEKAPAMGAFGTLVGNTRLSARGVRAFQGARLRAPEPAALPPPHVLSVILRVQNLFFCMTRRVVGNISDEWKKHPQWVLLVHSSGIEPESAAPEATVLSVILRVRNFIYGT